MDETSYGTWYGIWPWIAIASLGLFHGINPAMGWLFAVALALHRGAQRVVFLSLIPIAAGHAAAVALVLAGAVALGLIVDRATVARLAAAALIIWAAWHMLYGHRQRVRIGMQAGFVGLLVWSFLMATAHGAGLMIVPALQALCAPNASTTIAGAQAASITAAVLGVHSAAMLATIAAISFAVYKWIGVDFLRRGWVNIDLVWVGMLFVCGVALLV
jgi:hypothetical protein